MNEREAAIRVATDALSVEGSKRAAVFAAIAAHLHDGPARIPRRQIMAGYSAEQAEALLARLVADGWLRVTAEAIPGTPRIPGCGPKAKVGRAARRAVPGTSPTPRELDLGPAVARAYAPTRSDVAS